MFVICFISQWMKGSKHVLFVFPPKKTLIWRRHCSISQSCWSMTSNRSIDWFLESSWAWSFSPKRSLKQPNATRVCIRSINQSNRTISVRLLFLFCSRVFVSRSYEKALLTAAGCNQSLIQSHTQRKSLTMVYRKSRLSSRRPILCIYRTQAKNMEQTFW